MREYSTTPAADKHNQRRPRSRREWTDRERLAWTWERNPNHSSEAHCKRRRRMEGALARALRERDALVEGLRRRARRSARADELRRAAEQLALVTPASLGVRTLTHPPRGGGQRQLPYYIPDVALPAIAALLDLVRWARRLLNAEARGAWRARMRRVAVMLGAIVRDDTAYDRASPYPSTGEKAPMEPSLSGTSAPPDRNYWQRKEAVWRQRAAEERA